MEAAAHTSLEDAPFGTFAPSPGLWAATRALHPLDRRLATWGRKPLMALQRGPWDVTVDGFHLRLYPHSNVGERRFLFLPRHFDPIERNLLADHLHDGSTFIDVGANVGLYSLYAARAGADVLAIEPGETARARLAANLALNDYTQTVQIAPFAVGSAEGSGLLATPEKNLGASHLSSSGGQKVTVKPLTTLIAQFSAKRIDAMKVDVEGAEEDVLCPFLSTTPNNMKPHLLIVETDGLHKSEALVRLLGNTGYQRIAQTRLNSIYSL